MIKAIGTKDGKPLFVFGLSRGNCERLLEGKPIIIDLDVMAREIEPHDLRGAVVLCAGETEQSLCDELQSILGTLPKPKIDPDMP